ncbi:MAG: Trk potassium uptake system protein TrkH [uncultured Rubrobacteraceae bacterium]|uniref:Trk potassium uptake system protein TrkH n=1 Tax=uncultured Rubrobacteraceae bacterium TaxID=349277 RepID=A0A6J4PNQ8_9ACTN|nr:MAG: Trk potassium uptake system protein TrkH [uncultured Rubrobacteraceae bacterium]
MNLLNPRVIANALAALVAAVGATMLVPAAYALLTAPEHAWIFWVPGAAALALGAALFYLTRARQSGYVSTQSIFLMVVVCWLGVVLVGSAPFVLSGLMGPVDAFFNSMAGFTTTGAATLAPEKLSPTLLLWRSVSQWIGGIGIVVLFVAIAPLAGFGATQLYTAEAATPVQERVTPRIRETVKVLALVYGGLTLGGVVVLHLAGMGTFDAVNYALATVSTGGYSTHSNSVAAFDSWTVELAITAGMVLSGTNFAIYHTAARRGLGRAVGNAELATYLGVILASTMLITANLYASDHRDSLALAFREALFQSASLTTGTAYSTTDWSAWPPFSVALLVLIMAVGGCAGSTAGGMKAIRVYLLARNAAQEVFRLVHPRAITPLVLGDRVLPERLRAGVLGFFFVYVATLVFGTLLVALHQVPVGQAFGSVFACVNITGAFPGAVGTPQFYAGLPATAKAILAVFMLLGRLELFTVLVLLSPAFWRA